MERLSELIHILNRSELSVDTLLPDPEAVKLFHLVANGKADTDGKAARILYGSAANADKYPKLKRDLLKVLTELIFKTNSSGGNFTESQKLYFKIKKKLLIAETLLSKNVYLNAEKMILKAKACAEKYQMLELQIDCLKQLRTVYALKGFPKDVEFYNIVLKKTIRFFQYEQEAIGFIDLLESKTKHFIGKYREIALEAKHYAMQVGEWQKQSSSVSLKLCLCRIDVIRYYHIDNVREWHFTLEKLTDTLRKFPYLKTEALSLYLNLEWARYMRRIANLTDAFVFVEKALQQSSYDAFTKFEVQALHFDLHIKEQNYTQAGASLLELTSCKEFQRLEAQEQAAWLLREAYLYFILLSLNDETGIRTFTRSFTQGISGPDLVDACKAISEDKKGYNLMLLFLKEAFVVHKQPGHAESAANNMLVYYQKHIKDSSEERSKNFMKRVAKAIKVDLLSESVKKKRKSTDVQAKHFDAAELIPYDLFYELLMGKIKMDL